MRLMTLSAMLIGLVWATACPAAEPVVTTITMTDLDCPSCAKKVAAKLMEVPGVAKVETDVDTMTAKVTAKDKASISPKALWEAIEAAKKTPSKIVSPAGTFSEKPKA